MIQAALHWEDAPANRDHFSRRIAPLEGQSDLIILPEMFTTGFSMRADRLSEPIQGPTLSWMAEQASRSGAVITGSFIAREDDACYNRLVWMRPGGTYDVYDKRHLFTLAGEQNHYSAGYRRLLAEIKGWKVLPLICYDLRFPVWSRNAEDYDLLIYVANWPERRSFAWKSLLTARAIENMVYTIGVNRVGKDGNGVYHSGDSSLIDFAGALLYRRSHQSDVFTAELSGEEQQHFRAKFRFLADRDDFTIPGTASHHV